MSTQPAIIGVDHSGRAVKLVHAASGAMVHEGDQVFDFRGKAHKVEHGTPPHKPASGGHIQTDYGYFFVSVFNMEWRRI